MLKSFWFWLTHNASSSHHRLMANYLKRRGWVAFYLEEQSRQCVDHQGCWMNLYNQSEAQE